MNEECDVISECMRIAFGCRAETKTETCAPPKKKKRSDGKRRKNVKNEMAKIKGIKMVKRKKGDKVVT